jgi:hypothetical protein
MNVDLDDSEQADLIALLQGEVENAQFPMSPRIKRRRGILAKLVHCRSPRRALQTEN